MNLGGRGSDEEQDRQANQSGTLGGTEIVISLKVANLFCG